MAERIPSSEITPQGVYLNRRSFMRAGLLAATAAGTAVIYRQLNRVSLDAAESAPLTGLVTADATSGFRVNEPRTPRASILNYNNFYEFSTDKDGVAAAAAGFKTTGWTVEVGGLVHKPRMFDMDDIRRISPPEERVYRMRCVEAWSMVIPWAGIPLGNLIKRCAPTPKANYVRMSTLLDPKRMPGQRLDVLEWPYVEALRMDEAMHPLAILAVGIYGEALPNQDGAPIRLVVPWKYGFKGVKSIVKIEFTEKQPVNSWQKTAPREYGFYANVNPEVNHPRWSQASERRIGEFFMRKTLMFNGYAEQVASLYTGLDLKKNY
jgi:sulfoxide reductase catalytic subunit YedY